MRKFVLFVIMFSSFSLFGQTITGLTIEENIIIDNLISTTVTDIYNSFQEVPINKFIATDGRQIEGFGMYFESDINNKVYTNVKKLFTKTRFRVYEKERVDQLLQEQSIQLEDFYSKEGRLRVGKFTQWKGFLIGNVKSRIENRFGKKGVYLEMSCDFINLETGELIWSDNFNNYQKLDLSLYTYLIGIFLILLLTWLFNSLSKGKKTSLILSVTFVLLIGYSIWFFII